MKDNLPEFLYQKLLKQYGDKLTDQIIKGYLYNRYMTIRINTIKTDIKKVRELLESLEYEIDVVPWYNDALIIKNKGEDDIKQLDIYKNGEIYLQSLSSMLPALILNPKENESLLDMAAAPGSKTTQIACLTNNKALITACEKNKIRLERLKYNLKMQGSTRVTTLNEDASKLDDFFSFDKILLDSPCTGSGTINLNKKVIFTEKYLNNLVQTQKKLLQKAIKLLKKGHEMVYSTCSILIDENENILKDFLNKDIEIVSIDLNLFNNLPLLPTSIRGTLCICPNELYEGFFVAKIKKK